MYEHDTTATSRHTITGKHPNPIAAATGTSATSDDTATEIWVWDANATVIWWHGPSDAKNAANVQHGTDGRATFFLMVIGRVC